MTECIRESLEFHPLGCREVTARFDAPAITSDAGGLLLRELDEKFRFLAQLSQCFDDHRDPSLTVHPLEDLLAQRVFAIALGYEDLNDHEALRHDPLMAVLAGKTDPAPQEGFALAGKSTACETISQSPAGYAAVCPSQRTQRSVMPRLSISGYLETPQDRETLRGRSSYPVPLA